MYFQNRLSKQKIFSKYIKLNLSDIYLILNISISISILVLGTKTRGIKVRRDTPPKEWVGVWCGVVWWKWVNEYVDDIRVWFDREEGKEECGKRVGIGDILKSDVNRWIEKLKDLNHSGINLKLLLK